jgi:hypothetical protein
LSCGAIHQLWRRGTLNPRAVGRPAKASSESGGCRFVDSTDLGYSLCRVGKLATSTPSGPAELGSPAEHRRRSRRPIFRSRILLDSVLIVASVLLGFALNEWRVKQDERALAATALENFRREIRSNLATLERVNPTHARLAQQLGEAAQADTFAGATAFDVVVGLLPEGGLDTPPLREAAWEAAVSTGALRLLNYDTAALLSETYQIQRATLGPTMHRLANRFMDVPNFDPAVRAMTVRVHHMLFLELTGQERFLMEIYRRTLEELPSAPGS